jgi:bifunctional non-homologous end joining protein LigD
MSLKEYKEKRSFNKTPEPEGGTGPAALDNYFCVQRHDAARLHYDFRLELDGVLKSWAVPKGPSLEPLVKNLAMMVEDHPVEYGSFEGNIPKGQYGGGSVMLWDRGTWELLGDASAQAQLARGDMKFRLHGQKLSGEFAIVLMKGRGKGNEWLLIKKKDASAKPGWNIEDYAISVLTGRTQEEIAQDLPAKPRARTKRKLPAGAIESPLPAQVSPMLATLASKPPKSAGWRYEIKWDGVRALCFIEDNRVRMFTRAGNRCEQQYPELSVLPHYVDAQEAILDGEIAILDEQGRSKFSLIQPRIHVADPNTVAHLARAKPANLFLFDLLYLDGYDLRGVPLTDRRKLLAEIVRPRDRIRVSEVFEADGAAMLEAAQRQGLEGVVAKRADSLYEGQRSTNWIKVKTEYRQEFVIGGFTHGEREGFSSLVLGLYEDGKLKHAGQVGTGFTEKTIQSILQKLEPLISKKNPFEGPVKKDRAVTWVKPELVCEVKFLEFTPEGLLRAPVFIGLRDDKKATECVREGEEEPASPPQEALLAETQKEAALTIDGHALKFTNLDKIFYPADGIVKRDLINYYDAVAPWLLPHLRDRPLSLKRYPNGIEGQYFFQKEGEGKFPLWVRLEPIASGDKKINYVVANDRATLLYLANLACIDQNPGMSRIGSIDHPDFVLLDLDPYECPFDKIVEAAQLMRKILDAIGLKGYPKTTGGDGMHIYVPVEPVYSFDQVRTFAEVLFLRAVKERPELFTTPRAVSKRVKGKVYFDYLQIASAKTISAPYVPRAYPGAPVATPVHWDEVKPGLRPAQFHIRNAMERFRRVGDLFEGVLKAPQRFEAALERMV